MTDLERLEKAKAKALSHHFHKSAAFHHAKADHHEKAADMHKTHAEAHADAAGAAEEDGAKKYHKAAASFHKSKAAHHEKLHKLHKAHGAHHESMASSHEATDAEKIYKALEIEEDPLPANDNVAKTTAPAAAAPATPAAAAPATTGTPATEGTPNITQNFGEYIQKALDKKLGESVDGAFERLLSSEDFNKRVDQEVAKKMLEKLGATTIDTPVKTYPVGRPAESSGDSYSKGIPSEPTYENVPFDLVDLVKSAE